MEEVNNSGLMEVFMKDIGEKIWLKEKVDLYIQTEMFLLVDGNKIKVYILFKNQLTTLFLSIIKKLIKK